MWIQCIYSALSSAYYTLWLELTWPLGWHLHRHLSSICSTSPHRLVYLHSGLRCRYNCLMNGHVHTCFSHVPELSTMITSDTISALAWVKLFTKSTCWFGLSLGLHCLCSSIGHRYYRSRICWCSCLLDRCVRTPSCYVPWLSTVIATDFPSTLA